MDRSRREDRLRRDGRNPSLSSGLPSFSSSLLDEIYRSIDGGDDNREDLKLYGDRFAKKQSNGTGVKKAKVSSGTTIEDEEMASLRRACLIEKWMEKKVTDKVSGRRRQSLSEECNRKTKHRESDPLFFSSSSTSSDSSSGGFSSSEGEFLGMPKSRTSCFRTQKPKPVRTSVSEKLGKASYYEQSECYLFHDYQQNQPEDLKHPEQGLMKSKLRALNIYSNLKKVKQPISPGGKLASFLNSLFTNGNNTKKTKNSSSPIGGSEENSCVERKSKSTQASTCSSASSYTRSCLSKSSLNSKDKSSNGVKRTVRFFPVSVIVDEDCRPCGHKCINGGNSGEFGIGTRNKEERNHVLVENRRKIEEAAREILRKEYRKNDLAMGRDRNAEYEDDDGDDDAASDSSSDLFELDHLAFIGKNSDRYSEELPVYETTHLHANRAIANGLIC